MHRLVRSFAVLVLVVAAPLAAHAQTVKTFSLPFPDSQPWDVTLGPDGNMWFTEGAFNANRIGRLDAAGRITEFLTPSRTFTGSIVSGPDGALWFTEPSGFPFSIGRATTAGVITEFGQDLATCGPCSLTPYGIVKGPDNNIWFTEWVKNAVVKVDPATGAFTFFSTFGHGFADTGITVGADGALWFAINNTHKIGRIDTAGNITDFGPVADPLEMTLGADGNVWFTQPIDNSIGRITPSGAITIFPLPTPGAFPRDIVAGPDGNLWFTEHDVNRVARITTGGVITEVLQVPGGPWAIARGSSNSLWLTLKEGNKLATFTVSAPAPPTPATLATLTVSPATVVGGTAVSGTVALSGAAPAGGAVVSLADDSSAVALPATVTVPAGAISANFTATTSAVSTATAVTISAAFGGTTRNAPLSLTPSSPPPPTSLSAPSLVRPASDARFSPGASIAFDWSDVAGAASYTIEIDDSTTFGAPLVFTQTTTVSQATLGSLPTKRLWWRVRANGAAGNAGPWSSARRFELK